MHDAVAHPGDEIDKEFTSVGFGEPYRITDFALESIILKNLDRSLGILGGEEKIQIFGVTIDAGMRL